MNRNINLRDLACFSQGMKQENVYLDLRENQGMEILKISIFGSKCNQFQLTNLKI